MAVKQEAQKLEALAEDLVRFQASEGRKTESLKEALFAVAFASRHELGKDPELDRVWMRWAVQALRLSAWVILDSLSRRRVDAVFAPKEKEALRIWLVKRPSLNVKVLRHLGLDEVAEKVKALGLPEMAKIFVFGEEAHGGKRGSWRKALLKTASGSLEGIRHLQAFLKEPSLKSLRGFQKGMEKVLMAHRLSVDYYGEIRTWILQEIFFPECVGEWRSPKELDPFIEENRRHFLQLPFPPALEQLPMEPGELALEIEKAIEEAREEAPKQTQEILRARELKKAVKAFLRGHWKPEVVLKRLDLSALRESLAPLVDREKPRGEEVRFLIDTIALDSDVLRLNPSEDELGPDFELPDSPISLALVYHIAQGGGHEVPGIWDPEKKEGWIQIPGLVEGWIWVGDKR